MKYFNPILPGFHPDPSLCRVGEDYFLVNSSFEFFPGIPIFQSRDMVTWRQLGHCLTRPSQLDLTGRTSSHGIYAPTLRFRDGRFYLIGTDVEGIGNFILHSKAPAGDWSEPVRVAHPGIDPSLFWDDDGQCYFLGNASNRSRERGLFLNPIDPETGKLGWSESKRLWTGTGGQCPEGPHLYKRDGWYYLLAAEGGTEFGHMITVARSRSLLGPYEECPHNPILSHRSKSSPIQSTGHGDLFEDGRGNWWVVFLGVRHHGYPPVHHLGRETFLAPVEWTEEGWPVVNDGKLVSLEMDLPQRSTGLQKPPAQAAFHDRFQSEPLDLGWNFCRNPQPGSWQVDTENGGLVLECQPETLDGIGPKAWLGRRQQHFEAKAETEVSFCPGENEEAGLVVFMNERFHAEIALAARDGKSGILLRKRVGSMRSEEFIPLKWNGALRLQLTATREQFLFQYVDASGKTVEAGKIEPRLLSTELAGGFTGIYWALYASANGRQSSNTARFHWFGYSPC